MAHRHPIKCPECGGAAWDFTIGKPIRCYCCGWKPERCEVCALFGDTPPKGSMPGVSENHRQCMKPRLSKTFLWRNPSDWCQSFTAK